MAQEIHTLTTQPYAWAVMVVATFANGMSSRGTGALVGRNDILTATHVVYDPDQGGWAKDIAIYPGVDYNSQTGRFESDTLVDLDGARWRAIAWPDQVFVDRDHTTLTRSEMEYDIALIGLDQAVGDQLGWFGLAGGYDHSLWAEQLGYPAGSTGLMHGRAWIEREAFYGIYSGKASAGTDVMGRGSSGGPLYTVDDELGPLLIGVKSGGSDEASYWVDVGMLYEELVEEIAANDDLIDDLVRTLTGTDGNDRFTATSAREEVDGGTGTDILVFAGARAQFWVSQESGAVRIENLSNSRDIDLAVNVERFEFSDGTLALDVGLGEAAGQAFRLYQAAFARQPDSEGLAYWVADLDAGAAIQQVAAGFLQSDEFALLYGAALSDAVFVDSLYGNVLGRLPDDAGQRYWMDELTAGASREGVLVSFSESLENHFNTFDHLAGGLWLI